MSQITILQSSLAGGPANPDFHDASGLENPGRALPGGIPVNLTPPSAARLRGSRQIPAGDIHSLAGRAAPGSEGFRSRVGRWLSEGAADLGENLRELFNGPKARAGLPARIELRMPGGGAVTFPGSSLACMIKAVSFADRAAARESLVPTLESRLRNGFHILAAIREGRPPEDHSVQAVADLTLYLKASVAASGSEFSSGAFSVEDPEGRLAAWLNSCPEKYQRSSSHLRGTQSAQVDGHRNTHRGIDIPQGIGGLPHGHATLLFGVIPETQDMSRRLFFKPETHGCRLSTLSAGDRAAGNDAVPDRPWRGADVRSCLQHGWSYVWTRFSGGEGRRRESLPGDLKKSFKALQTTFRNQGPIASRLASDDPCGDSRGVRIIIKNMRDCLNSLRDRPCERREFLVLSAPVRQALSRLAEVNHLDARFGNEVVCSMDELLHPRPRPLTDEEKLDVINTALRLTDEEKRIAGAVNE